MDIGFDKYKMYNIINEKKIAELEKKKGTFICKLIT